jgi:hypothetical protein
MNEKIETLAEVKSRQGIWVDWMRKATEGLADTDLVRTVTHVTPFGRFLKLIEPVEVK